MLKKMTLEGLCRLLTVDLKEGDEFYTDYNMVRNFSPNVIMESRLRSNWIRRATTGERAYWQHFKCVEGEGQISITTDDIGEPIIVELKPGEELFVDRQSFIGADSTVTNTLYLGEDLKKGALGTGLLFHKLTGYGTAYISVDGKCDEWKLKPGESQVVDPDYLIMFRQPIDMSLHNVEGFVNKAISGPYWVKITGPATFYLDRMVGDHSEKSGLLVQSLRLLKNYLWPV